MNHVLFVYGAPLLNLNTLQVLWKNTSFDSGAGPDGDLEFFFFALANSMG
jgi:hypothetical protein